MEIVAPADATSSPTTHHHLGNRLVVPYFVNSQGIVQRPEHLIAWWIRIFSFLHLLPTDRYHIRRLCHLFNDALPRHIVIDVGTFSIKAGYANALHFYPSVVLPTPGNGIFGDKKEGVQQDEQSTVPNDENNQDKWTRWNHSQIDEQFALQKEFTEVDIWPFESDAMADIWRSVFERLGTTPKMHNATGGGVLICTPRHIPEPCVKLCKEMFEDLGVHKLYLACKSALVLHAHGFSEGVVVNCGFSNIDVESVMSDHAHDSNFASAQIKGGAKHIIAQVAKHCGLPKHHACDFVRQHCYVPLDFDAKTETYYCGDDVFFQPKNFASETETKTEADFVTLEVFNFAKIGGLPQMVFNQQHFQQMKEEAAQRVDKNIECDVVLSGGLSKMTGLKGRLEQDLKSLLGEHRTLVGSRIHSATLGVNVVMSEHPEYDVWKGGALVALALSDHEWYHRAGVCIHHIPPLFHTTQKVVGRWYIPPIYLPPKIKQQVVTYHPKNMGGRWYRGWYIVLGILRFR